MLHLAVGICPTPVRILLRAEDLNISALAFQIITAIRDVEPGTVGSSSPDNVCGVCRDIDICRSVSVHISVLNRDVRASHAGSIGGSARVGQRIGAACGIRADNQILFSAGELIHQFVICTISRRGRVNRSGIVRIGHVGSVLVILVERCSGGIALGTQGENVRRGVVSVTVGKILVTRDALGCIGALEDVGTYSIPGCGSRDNPNIPGIIQLQGPIVAAVIIVYICTIEIFPVLALNIIAGAVFAGGEGPEQAVGGNIIAHIVRFSGQAVIIILLIAGAVRIPDLVAFRRQGITVAGENDILLAIFRRHTLARRLGDSYSSSCRCDTTYCVGCGDRGCALGNAGDHSAGTYGGNGRITAGPGNASIGCSRRLISDRQVR